MVATTPLSCFCSLPSSWAFFGSFQTEGSSSEALTVLRRSDLASKSKIPPEIGRPGLQVLQGGTDQVDAFCVHCSESLMRPARARRGAAGPVSKRVIFSFRTAGRRQRQGKDEF